MREALLVTAGLLLVCQMARSAPAGAPLPLEDVLKLPDQTILSQQWDHIPLPALPASQDAKVAGTRFHATTQLPCKPPYGAAPTRCEAGVVRRGRDGTATVEIRGPNQLLRQILFVKGEPTASDATDPMTFAREGDSTMVKIGADERYTLPDALVRGG